MGRSEAAVRQMAHRAREHVAARRPRFAAEPAVHLDVTRRFVAACAGGGLESLLDVLAPDVVLTSDGGGLARAARRPITGADDVARFLVGVAGKAPEGTTIDVVQVNAAPAVVARVGGQVLFFLQLVLTADGVSQVFVIANPEKLAALDDVRQLTA
jgi:RNA polymerase sigma-70 factor (ECF subfamily)